MKPVLPAGTVISYLGVKAVVIEDGPTEFLVLCEGNHESWWWECDGHTCEIVTYPSGSTHQPASTVQGEPVGWQFYQYGKWWNGDDRIKDHRKNTEEAGFRVRDVYAVPQPAEQQPEPISRNLRAVHAMILRALDRDAANGKAVRGEMAAELRSALSEQPPSPNAPTFQPCDHVHKTKGSQWNGRVVGTYSEPDVSVLVGALERIELMDSDDHSLFNAVLVARAALAAHHKGSET